MSIRFGLEIGIVKPLATPVLLSTSIEHENAAKFAAI